MALKNIDGRFGFLRFNELTKGVIRVTERIRGAETVYADAHELIEAGWVVDPPPDWDWILDPALDMWSPIARGWIMKEPYLGWSEEAKEQTRLAIALQGCTMSSEHYVL